MLFAFEICYTCRSLPYAYGLWHTLMAFDICCRPLTLLWLLTHAYSLWHTLMAFGGICKWPLTYAVGLCLRFRCTVTLSNVIVLFNALCSTVLHCIDAQLNRRRNSNTIIRWNWFLLNDRPNLAYRPISCSSKTALCSTVKKPRRKAPL